MSILANKNQIIKLHTLLTKLGISDKEKRFMVIEASQGRTRSSKELTEMEINTIIGDLEETYKLQQGDEAEVMDKLRKRVISLYREMGSNTFSPSKGIMVADMDSINKSLVEHWKRILTS